MATQTITSPAELARAIRDGLLTSDQLAEVESTINEALAGIMDARSKRRGSMTDSIPPEMALSARASARAMARQRTAALDFGAGISHEGQAPSTPGEKALAAFADNDAERASSYYLASSGERVAEELKRIAPDALDLAARAHELAAQYLELKRTGYTTTDLAGFLRAQVKARDISLGVDRG